MHMIQKTVAAGLIGVLAGLGACGAQTAKPKPSASRTQAEPDPITASSIREGALTIVESFAVSVDPQLRGNAIEAAALAPARTVAIVKEGLKDPNPGVRSVAAMTVGRARLTSLVSRTRPLIDDDSPYVRASAIFALHACGEPVDPTPLADMLLRDPSVRVRCHAAFVLGELRDRSALPLLRDALRVEVPKGSQRLLELQIAEAMIKLGELEQVKTIRAALYPARPEELEATALAVQILGEVKDQGSIDQLIRLSEQRDRSGHLMPAEVRLGIAGSLAKVGLRKGDFIADEYVASDIPALRAQAAYVYGETSKPANLFKLNDLMNDPEGIVRISAAAAVLRVSGHSSTFSGAMQMK